MIKADIVKRIAKDLNINDRDALGVVDHIIESVKLVVNEQGRLEIRDFGVFQVKSRKARIGRNPRNKKEYPIAPHKVVTFKPGKNLTVHAAGEARSAGGKAERRAEAAPAPRPMPHESDLFREATISSK